MTGFTETDTLIAAAAIRLHARAVERRDGVHMPGLWALAEFLDPRQVIAEDDDTMTALIRKREQWRAASQRYRDSKKADRLAAGA